MFEIMAALILFENVFNFSLTIQYGVAIHFRTLNLSFILMCD